MGKRVKFPYNMKISLIKTRYSNYKKLSISSSDNGIIELMAICPYKYHTIKGKTSVRFCFHRNALMAEIEFPKIEKWVKDNVSRKLRL